MLAAELLAKAAAAGVDLSQVGGTASRTDGVAAKRKLTRQERRLRQEAHIGLEVMPAALGNSTRVYRRPDWSAAELGQAAFGVPRMPWLAARLSFAGDASGYQELHRGLMHQALEMSEREHWPWRVRGRDGSMRFYLAELAEVVLDAETHKDLFLKAPGLYAICLGVDEDVWSGNLAIRYTSLQLKYERWVDAARGMIQRWLRAAEETHREMA